MAANLSRRMQIAAIAAITLASGVVAHAATQPGTSTASPVSAALQACYTSCKKKHKDATAYEGCMIDCRKANPVVNPAGNGVKLKSQ